MTNDALAEFLAARRRNLEHLEGIGRRINAWLSTLNLAHVDWSTLAHFERLNIERQTAIRELQEAEQHFGPEQVGNVEALIFALT